MDITKSLFLVARQVVEGAEDPRGSLVQEEPRPDLQPLVMGRSLPPKVALPCRAVPSLFSTLRLRALLPVPALPGQRARTLLSQVLLLQAGPLLSALPSEPE